MNKKRLKTVAAIACAFTCAFGFAACTNGNDNSTNPPDDTQRPNYQPSDTPDATLAYELSADGRGYFVTGIGALTETNISIPSTFNGLPVIGIADAAFSGRDDLTGIALGANLEYIGEFAFNLCSGLTNIRIPAAVKAMGDRAFMSCTGLRTVVFTEGSQLSTMGQSVFQNCTALSTISIPDSVTIIGQRAFQGCTHLKTIVIGEGVTTIGVDAFRNCSMLNDVKVGSNVKVIEAGAFQKCTSLTKLVLPASITYMGANMFFDCIALKSLTIPFVGEGTRPVEEITDEDKEPDEDGDEGEKAEPAQPKTYFLHLFGVEGNDCPVTDLTILGGGKIADHAFDVCNNLQQVKICSGVTEIGLSAFYVCYGISTLIMSNSVTSIGAGSFYATGLNTLYYEGTQEEYNRISIEINNQNLTGARKYYYSEKQPTTSGNFWHYVDGEPVVW